MNNNSLNPGSVITMNTGALSTSNALLISSGSVTWDGSAFGYVAGVDPYKKEFLYDDKLVYDNIDEIWQQHLSQDYQEGKNWYKEAKHFSIELAQKHNRPDMITAAVISALSPQKQWDVNKKLANDFFQFGYNRTGHYYKQKAKAKTIDNMRHNPSIKEEDIDIALGGLKTVNFFHNIYDPKNTDHVCIDRHMIAIALGYSKSKLTTKQYTFLKENYIKFANKVGMIPCEAQGVLWVTYRRVKTPNFKEPDIF